MAREEVWRWSIFLLFVAGCSDRRLDENVGSLSEKLRMGSESEPNGALAQATPLAVPTDVVMGNIMPSGDVDYYSFTGVAGDRVYAATQTATSPNAQPDSMLTLLGSEGMPIETDDDDGWFPSQSSSIAGAVLPAPGTYYLQVSHYDPLLELRPYRLHFQKRSGLPQSEIEPNDPPQTVSTVAGAGAWLAGSVSSDADVDYYFLALNAGDTIFASLDTDPERDGTDFNAHLGAGLFPNIYFWANDGGVDPAPDSEAFFTTVQAAGMYGIRVGSGAPSSTGTYVLSVTAHPAASRAGCTTYTSLKIIEIPPGPAIVTAKLDVPDDIVIGDVDVDIDLYHESPADLDVHLISPAGGRTGLFTDVGNTSYPYFLFTLDDEAGIAVNQTPTLHSMRLQPESAYRLSWLDGQRAQGTWTLEIRDDQANHQGTLTSWGITICPAATAPSCQAGYVPNVVYSTDFETNDGGFTHSGAADEWAHGTPSAEPITTCKSGTQCFKTDLSGTYQASSSQDLVSPPIDLAGVTEPVRVRWAQKLQMDNATTDHAWVEVRNADATNPRRIYEFLDGNMTDSIGEPPTTVNESAGWSIREADISEYAGESVELVFHVDSDAATNLAGLAIDDVSVTSGCVLACGNGSPDSGETCDDGNTTSGDGCDSNCTPTGCGNGVPTTAEECDDGNLMSGDGCDGSCQIETGLGGSGGGGGLGGAALGGAGAGGGGVWAGAGGTGAGAGGASGGGGSPLGGAAGAFGAEAGGLGGAGRRGGTDGDAGSSGTSAGGGGKGAETGSGGDAGATGGEAGESGGSAGSSGSESAGAAGAPSDAGAAGDSGEPRRRASHSDEDNGCGCRVVGKHERFDSWIFAGLAAGAVFVRRRRRRPAAPNGA